MSNPKSGQFSLKVAVGLAASYAAMPIIALITSPVLARALGPEARGEVAAISAPLTLAEGVAAFGLPIAAAYFTARGVSPRTVMRTALPLALASGIATYAVLFAVAPFLFSSQPELVSPFRLVSLYIILVALIGLARGVRNGEERYGLLTYERWLQAGSRLVLIVALAAFGALTTNTAVWINVVCASGAGLLLFGRFRGASASATRDFSTSVLGRYSLSSWGTQLASAANARLDQAVMILFVSPTQLGFYVVAAMAAELPMTVFSAVQRVVIGSASGDDRRHRVLRAARLCTAAGLIIIVVGIPLAPLAVWILFGSDFSEASRLLQILLLGVLPWGVGQVLTGGLVAANAPKLASRAELIALAITAIGLAAMAPRFGVVGVAWLSVIAYLCATVLKLLWFCRLTGVGARAVLLPTREDKAWVSSKLRRGQ